jgi:hypothetical protein
LSQELLGSVITEGLVRADGVVGLFPGLELMVELGDRERARGDFIKFLRMGAIGSFDLAVEFGRAGRKHEEAQAPLLTGLLKDGGELTASIDLQGAVAEKADGAAEYRGTKWRPWRWRGDELQ